MGLLLPVLLLGLAQPADLPSDAPDSVAQQQNGVSAQIPARKFSFDAAKSRAGVPVDRIVIGDTPGGDSTSCLTMRSYYFERRDGLAPKFVGMTTCEPVHKFTTKKIGRPARLVPAN